MGKIELIIKNNAKKGFRFKPNPEFYSTVNIKRRRWGMIYRGETSPTLTEAKAIAEFFEIPVTDLIE